MEKNDPVADEFATTLNAVAAAVNTPASKNSADRIAELRRLYLSGQYRPSAQDIASKIVDEHLS
jgi:anti-sigma28 factor (negative regulator of flagellin synthesis)